MAILVDVLGWVGTVLLVAAYALLTLRRIRVEGLAYQLMNLVGGVLLLINTAYHGAWPSAGLNLVWFFIGLVGVAQFVIGRRRTSLLRRATD